MRISIEPIYGENPGAVVEVIHTPDEVEEYQPLKTSHIFSFEWFPDKYSPPKDCPIDGLINMLYAILDECGYCSGKYDQHNIVINCVAGRGIDDPVKCPNRPDCDCT